MADADVLVVGAGLAGLRCASDLVAAGLNVLTLEGRHEVGGRVRTDRIDGFLVDHGFQLLNPAYPAVVSGIDVRALELQPFDAGVVGRTEAGVVRLGHPLRAPELAPATAWYAARHPREVAAMLRWARPLLRPSAGRLADRLTGLPTLNASLDGAGVHGTLRRVVERFLAGTLLDDHGETPAALAQLLVASFLKGTPGLPAEGMRALPHQLAGRAGEIRLEAPVERLVRGGGEVVAHGSDGSRWSARAVVVATDGPAAAHLLGGGAPAMRGVVTAWWEVPDAPPTALLHVDARERPGGPVLNTAVVSAAAPSYAPPGRHLVQASALLTSAGSGPSIAELRAHAADLLGTTAGGWEVVAVHDVPRALPAMPTPFTTRRPVRVADGVFVCGDHQDTPSIQGALVSGRRTAAAVLAERRDRK